MPEIHAHVAGTLSSQQTNAGPDGILASNDEMQPE